MIFMVLVGGLGTFGPDPGRHPAVRNSDDIHTGWPVQLVGLGATAALFALVLPQVGHRRRSAQRPRLSPVGYRVVEMKSEESTA